MHLPTLLAKARTSGLTRWWLNAVMPWTVPFNRPHGFKVEPLPTGGIGVRIPNWRINRNHINGIHACALATAAEMCSGLSVLEQLDPKKYRLIMRSLHMEYLGAACFLGVPDLGDGRKGKIVDHDSIACILKRKGAREIAHRL